MGLRIPERYSSLHYEQYTIIPHPTSRVIHRNYISKSNWKAKTATCQEDLIGHLLL